MATALLFSVAPSVVNLFVWSLRVRVAFPQMRYHFSGVLRTANSSLSMRTSYVRPGLYIRLAPLMGV